MPQSIPSASCLTSSGHASSGCAFSGHAPLGVGWEELYKSAVLELNEDRLPERVAAARRAILDRVEEILTTARTDEHRALTDPLHFFLLLHAPASMQSAPP